MTTMRVPSRPMLALRTIATLQLSAVIGQAGWAAAALGRGGPVPPYDPTTPGGDDAARIFQLNPGYLHLHAFFAAVTLALCVIGAILYAALRSSGGPVNLWLAVASLVAVVAQYVLGETGVVDIHVFLGVLIAMLVTALTSWTYRHDDGGPPAFGPGATPAPGRASERGEGGAHAA